MGVAGNAPVFLIIVAAYSLGAHAPPRRSAAALAGGMAALALVEALTGGSDYLFLAFLLLLPWLAGAGVRRHREQTERLRALTRRLEQERAISEQVAVARERQRMAYETGDGIGHAVSEMALQAAGAQELLALDPERARRALIAVQDDGPRGAGAAARCARHAARRRLPGRQDTTCRGGRARAWRPGRPPSTSRSRWPCSRSAPPPC